MKQSLRGWPNNQGATAQTLEETLLDRLRNAPPKPSGEVVPFPSRKRKQIPPARRALRTLKRFGRASPAGRVLYSARYAYRTYQLWQQINGQNFTGWALPGYTLKTVCPVPPPNWQDKSTALACYHMQAGGDPLNTKYSYAPSGITWAFRYPIASGYRWSTSHVWYRDPGTTECPQREWTTEPVTRTAPLPALDVPGAMFFPDEILPGMNVIPTPLPQTFAAKMPFDDPYKYQGRHREPKDDDEKKSKTDEAPHLMPYEIPAVTREFIIKVESNGQIKTETILNRQAKHVLAKPPPNVRETKFTSKWGRFYVAISHYIWEPSEWLDLLDAFYQALPEKLQGKYSGSIASRVRGVLDNFDKLDYSKVAFNIVYNHFEDKLYGKANRALDKKGIDALGPDAYYRMLRGVMIDPPDSLKDYFK